MFRTGKNRPRVTREDNRSLEKGIVLYFSKVFPDHNSHRYSKTLSCKTEENFYNTSCKSARDKKWTRKVLKRPLFRIPLLSIGSTTITIKCRIHNLLKLYLGTDRWFFFNGSSSGNQDDVLNVLAQLDQMCQLYQLGRRTLIIYFLFVYLNFYIY